MFQTFKQPRYNMNEEEVNQALDAIRKKDNGSKALDILNVISYFAPENIHTKIFLSTLGNKEELAAAIKLLERYSIVDSDRKEAVLSVDRLAQKIMRTNLQKQEKEENILMKALELLFEDGINANNLDHSISVWSYVSRLFENITNSNQYLFVWRYRDLIEEASALPCHIVNELSESVRYKEANIFGWKAFDLLKRLLGESHPATLALQRHMGVLLGFEGKYKEALEVFQSLFKKDIEVSGQKEIMYTSILIAGQLCKLSRYNEALPIYQSLLGGQQVSDTRDSVVLAAWYGYSIVLMELGKYRESLEILEEIVEKNSEILGVEFVNTMSVKSCIGNIFFKQSKYCEALEVFQEVFYNRVAVLGENHIDTLQTRNNVASVLLEQDKYDEALEIYEVVAKKLEQILGKEHPFTINSQVNLASVFNRKGEFEKALEIYKDVYKKQKGTLGPEHNETLNIKRNIALVLFEQEKYDEALMTFREVFQGFNKIFGPTHRDTVEVMNITKCLNILSLNTVHSIARQGNLNKMRSLVQKGVDINKKDVYGNTPLHYAGEYGHISVIRLLLESGAIFNTKNNKRKTPFQLTDDSVIKNLLYSVAKLFKEVKFGNQKQVAELVKEKTIINAKEDGGSSSLHWAVYNGHSSIVKLLLESGADVTQVTNKGNTPLHTATSKGHNEIVDVLLQHASHNQLNDFIDAKTTVSGATSLHVAAKNGSLDVTKSLLKRGAKYNIKNNDGNTPLDLSKDNNVNDLLKLVGELFTDAKNGNVKIISKLKAAKADEFIAVTNARNAAGNTFLQVAIEVTNRHENIVSKLLEMLRRSD